MRVDCHLHVGPRPGASLSQRAESLCTLLKQYELDAAVVLPLDGLLSNCVDHRADNDFVYRFSQQQPQHLIPALQSIRGLAPERSTRSGVARTNTARRS